MPITSDFEFEIRDLSDDEKRLEYAEIIRLKEAKSWVSLVAQAKDKEARETKKMQIGLLSGETLDQRDVDYLRGFIAGLRWVTNAPSAAERRYGELTKGK